MAPVIIARIVLMGPSVRFVSRGSIWTSRHVILGLDDNRKQKLPSV